MLACWSTRFIRQFLSEQDRLRTLRRERDASDERAMSDYWESVRQREAEEVGRLAARKEAADRIYDRLRREKEEADAARTEQEDLINLLHQVK
jgi:hypothetical protein